MTTPVGEADPEPEWLTLFRAFSSPEDVAAAWKAGLSPELVEVAKTDAMTVVRTLRRAIVDSPCAEVRADAANGWEYTGAVMRAADAVLGVAPPKPRFNLPAQEPLAPPSVAGSATSALVAEAPSAELRFQPRKVLDGDGSPGTLGIWWSDFETACNARRLKEECGVTHRLNMAAEAKGKFPEEKIADGAVPNEVSRETETLLETLHVPMQDQFDPDSGLCDDWPAQLQEIIEILRSLRCKGSVVNINCNMGKNRSGAAILLWLCLECGWSYATAVNHLRSLVPLACGNPHLVAAVAQLLKVDEVVPLNPGADGGGWVCISPPGSPRLGAGAVQKHEDTAAEAMRLLEELPKATPAEAESEEAKGDDTEIFAGIEDVDGLDRLGDVD
mmetsp:Transcript_129824/g.277110  ORF Transcript_129824/g.277110 Transcript_129824/m.277110 type:complete len:387 (+) Transcript_129824:37-1197(+)